EKRKCGVVIRHGSIAGRNDQLFGSRKLDWHVDFVRAWRQVERHLELRNRRCTRIDAVARLLEPACKFSDIEGLQRIGIKASQAHRTSLRAPDAQVRRRDEKWPAIAVEGETRLIGLLLNIEGHYISNRALFALMGPIEALPRDRRDGWKGLPVP